MMDTGSGAHDVTAINQHLCLLHRPLLPLLFFRRCIRVSSRSGSGTCARCSYSGVVLSASPFIVVRNLANLSASGGQQHEVRRLSLRDMRVEIGVVAEVPCRDETRGRRKCEGDTPLLVDGRRRRRGRCRCQCHRCHARRRRCRRTSRRRKGCCKGESGGGWDLHLLRGRTGAVTIM
jgi:hypothetical protein